MKEYVYLVLYKDNGKTKLDTIWSKYEYAVSRHKEVSKRFKENVWIKKKEYKGPPAFTEEDLYEDSNA